MISYGGNIISSEAEAKADKLINAIILSDLEIIYDEDDLIPYSLKSTPGLKIERKELSLAARKFAGDDSLYFLAHGTRSPYSLCQILIDEQLTHMNEEPTHGDLSGPVNNFFLGGYLDEGWGIFVIEQKRLWSVTYDLALSDNSYSIPLSFVTGIILPESYLPTVKDIFPQHKNLLHSYKEFSKLLLDGNIGDKL